MTVPLMVTPGLYEQAIGRGIDPKYIDLMFAVSGTTDVQSAGGANANGVADTRAQIMAADQLVQRSGGRLGFTPGRYRVSANLNIQSAVVPQPEAVLVPDNGVTITIFGPITAGLSQWIDTSKGGTVNFTQSPTAYPQWWGADSTGAVSSQVALDGMRAWASLQARPITAAFPAGTYQYATSPDWRIQNLTLAALGNVVLQCTGAGVACRFGADAASDNLYNVRTEGLFVVVGNAATTDALFVRNMHHSDINFQIRNAVNTGARVQGCVLTDLRLVSSTAAAYGGMTTIPAVGLSVEASPQNTASTTCHFDYIIEGMLGDGVEFTDAVGCSSKGTSEGNSGVGVKEGSRCSNNTFDEVFCEANLGGDFEFGGARAQCDNCTASSTTGFGGLHYTASAVSAFWLNGFFNNALIETGAQYCGLLWYKSPQGVVDNGTGTWDQGLDISVSLTQKPAKIPQLDVWTNATYAGTWTNTSAAFPRVQYNRNWSTGEVLMKGEAGAGAAGSVIFNLPAGLKLRPTDKARVFICPATGSKDFAIVQVDTAGNVTQLFGATASITLDEISFVP